MLPCTFLRINNNVYNANLVQRISFGDQVKYESRFGPLVTVSILFFGDYETQHFYTYYVDLGQIMYDWGHSLGSFFEIPYLTLEDAKKMDVEFKKQREKEMKEYEQEQE